MNNLLPLRNISIFLVSFLLANQVAGQNQLRSKNKWIDISISNEMKDHLATLDTTEKLDQCRDWIKFAVIKALDFSKDVNFRMLFDFNPSRTQYAKSLSNYDYGEGRYIIGTKDTLYLIVPANSERQKSTIIGLADDVRMITGKKPSFVRLIEYKIDRAGFFLSFAYTSDILANTLYSGSYGYVEESVSTNQELASFLTRIDDIVFAKSELSGARFGGRKYPNYSGKKIGVEDVAVIYQAGNKLFEKELARIENRGLELEYEKHIKDLVAYNIKKDPSFLVNNSIPEIQEMAKKQFPYYGYVYNYVNDLTATKDNLHIGFSLDHDVKYKDFYQVLKKITDGDSIAFKRLFKTEVEKILMDQILELKKEDSVYQAEGYYAKETSLNSLLRLEEEQMDAEEDSDNDLYKDMIQKAYYNMKSAVAKNRPLLADICRQILNEKGARRLLLYYHIRNYLRGEYQLDIRKAVNPEWNNEKQIVYNRAIADLSEALYNAGYLEKKTNTLTPAMKKAVKSIQSYGRGVPGDTSNVIINDKLFWEIIRVDPAKDDELYYLGLFLDAVLKPYSYQKARYDGDFQGTKVGMTMFYTDLLMKLWSFNYKASATSIVPGFVPETDFKISALFKDEIKNNPYTRSWLGPQESAFRNNPLTKEVYLKHCTTRIFNASSSDLNPGMEIPATITSERFANWWNTHYTDMADYETEFHRLNQIMKWSYIVSWLKTSDKFSWLDYVTDVERNLDFESWYKNNKTLMTKVDIPFLNKRELGESTECIDILQSAKFRQFKELSLEYYFYGGVSLVNKNVIAKNITNSRNMDLVPQLYKRAGIRDFRSATDFTITDSRYIISPLQSKTLVNSKSLTGFKSESAEVFKLSFNRNVKTSPAKLEVTQTEIQRTNVSLGSIEASSGNNSVKLSGTTSDLDKYTEAFAGYRYWSDRIYLSADEKLLKVPGTKTVAIEKRIKPEAVKDVSKNASASDFIYTDGYNTYHVRLLEEAEFERNYIQNGWFKVSGDYAWKNVSLVQRKTPPTGEMQFYLTREGYQNKIIYDGRDYFIKLRDASTDQAVASILATKGETLLDIASLENSQILLRSKEGLLSLSSKQGVQHVVPAEFKQLFTGVDKEITAVVVRPGTNEIKFIERGILQIPSLTPTSQQREIIQFVLERSADSRWRSVFTSARNLSYNDISLLKQILPENAELASSYFKLKIVDNLDESTAITDLVSSSRQPQFIIKTGKGPVELKTITSGRRSMDEAAEKILKLYGDNTSEYSFGDIISTTKDYADILREAAASTNAKKIITIERQGINSEMINKLHNISAEKTFCKDQPDIVQSISNAAEDININFGSAVFLSTVKIKGAEFAKIILIRDSLKFFGVKQYDSIRYSDFKKVVMDSLVKQINLVIRGNKTGLIFSDGLVSYGTISYFLRSLTRRYSKDFIYIISNQVDTLETIFANSGRFSRIITSAFAMGDKTSLDDAFSGLKLVYSKAYHEKLTMPADYWRSISEDNGSLEQELGGYLTKRNKEVTIAVGKIRSRESRSFFERFTSMIKSKAGSGNRSYKPKDIDMLLHEAQVEKLRDLPARRVKPVRFLRSIPVLKCWIRPSKAISTDC